MDRMTGRRGELMKKQRLTTDTPKGPLETILNYASAKDGNVYLSYGDGEKNVNLCEYISRMARKHGCFYSAQEILEGACTECDCEIAILYCVAAQAAEMRARLSDYEDTGLSPEEVTGLCDELKRAKENEKARGFWRFFGRNYSTTISKCSCCGALYDFTPPHCPNCGAKMEEDDE